MKGLSKKVYFGLGLIFFSHLISRILLQFHIWVGIISEFYLPAYLLSTDLSLKIIGIIIVCIFLKNKEQGEKHR